VIEEKHCGQKGPRHRRETEESADEELLEHDRRFEQLSSNEKSAEYEKDGNAMLACLSPWASVVMEQAVLDVVEKHERDGDAAPTVESGDAILQED
jgi:hypothetical protein